MAFMPLFAVALGASNVQNNTVLNGVETPVHAFCDGQEYDINTEANIVSDALKETPCALEQNDIVTPSADTKLNGTSVDVHVTKAMPVTVVDGSKIIQTKSAYKDPSDILKQLNVTIYPEDKVTSELIISNFNKDGFGQKITIERRPKVSLEVDGKTLNVTTSQDTVGNFLKSEGVSLGVKDEVTPSLDTQITRGMTVVVVRVNEVDTTEVNAIPFDTINKTDYNLLEGQNRIESAGSDGLAAENVHIVYKNGVEVSRAVMSTQVLQAPKTKVVVIGAKPYGVSYLWGIMVEAGQKYGVNPGDMYSVMMCESSGRVNAVNRWGYKGLFQWDGSFHSWARTAGVPDDYFNPRSQIFATAARVSESGGWGAWSCKP